MKKCMHAEPPRMRGFIEAHLEHMEQPSVGSDLETERKHHSETVLFHGLQEAEGCGRPSRVKTKGQVPTFSTSGGLKVLTAPSASSGLINDGTTGATLSATASVPASIPF